MTIETDRLDAEARTMLRDRAITDPDKRVRAADLQVLGEKMRHDALRESRDTDIEALLRDRATSDDDPDVCAAAAKALAGGQRQRQRPGRSGRGSPAVPAGPG